MEKKTVHDLAAAASAKEEGIKSQRELLRDLKTLIESGRGQAVAAVNSTITVTYWHVGKRINEEILHGERAEYGKQVIPSLAQELVQQYGRSFEARNLRRMMQFAEVFKSWIFGF